MSEAAAFFVVEDIYQVFIFTPSPARPLHKGGLNSIYGLNVRADGDGGSDDLYSRPSTPSTPMERAPLL